MDQETTRIVDMELGDYVEAYEAAQCLAGEADLAAFLPSSDHPLRLPVLRELVRVDLEYGWQQGRPRSLEDYQRTFPELVDDPDGLADIAFEEYRQRQQAGEYPSPTEYAQRYGVDVAGWPGKCARKNGVDAAARLDLGTHVLDTSPPGAIEEAALAYQVFRLESRIQDPSALDAWQQSYSGSREHAAVFCDLHRTDPAAAERLAMAATRMPEAGSTFLGFQLLQELGRGGFGRVYLAKQGELANRYVALKISANLQTESQTLAQLQHTNVVPIYSVHQAGPLQAVCMPYFGSTTLADVLKELANHPELPDSGKRLVSTLNARRSVTQGGPGSGSHGIRLQPAAAQAQLPLALQDSGLRADGTQTLRMLEGFTHVQAVLWLALRLADGLAHAHDRGILHRDLKPANVLLTDDGQPMLLDFNLSEDTKLRGSASAARIGGTLPYMAPEHLEAFKGGKRPVDARSDLYALGIILYELLAGQHPFPVRHGALHSLLPEMIADRLVPAPDIRRRNPAVSPAVASLIHHCLDPDPARRYQSAAQLHEDLDRQLKHLPLKYAPEPSLRERAHKWVRRHPRLASSTTVGALAGAVILVLALGLFYRQQRLTEWEDLQAARTSLEKLQEEKKTVQFLLSVPSAHGEQLERGMRDGRLALERYQILENPDWEALPIVRALPSAERERLRNDLGELLALLAQTKLPESPISADGTKGSPIDSDSLRRRAEEFRLHPVSQHCLEAREHIEQGRLKEAIRLLDEAKHADPRNFWAWYLLGLAAEQVADLRVAESYYDICVSLWPDAPFPYFKRGLIYLRQKDYERALADFDQVIQAYSRQPGPDASHDLADAYFNRALARNGLKQYAESIQDLDRAQEHGFASSRLYLMRSRVRQSAGDRAGAQRDFDEGMRQEPSDSKGWEARGVARLARDPQGALADFDMALKLNPRSGVALQNKAHVLAERLGRADDAIAVLNRTVELQPGSALALAGRGVLLARRGDREAALEDARAALALDPSRARWYQVACIYALTSKQNPDDRVDAFRLLRGALSQGYGWDLVEKDHDLDPLRDRPEFRRLVDAARVLRPAPLKQASK